MTAEEDGRLIGIAPLFFSRKPRRCAGAAPPGQHRDSDYLDLIVRPEDVTRFVEGLLEFLDGLPAPEWRVLDWYNILEDSPTLPAMEKAAQERQWPCSLEQLAHSPYIPLKGSWEEYLAGINKKQRHEIRRKMRRARAANSLSAGTWSKTGTPSTPKGMPSWI